MLQTLNFAGARQIDAKASFFRYETCNASGADESIRVRADGNDLGLFLPGDYVDLQIFATRWEVAPTTATATGTVRLGAGKVGSSRLTGNVRVIDNSADLTTANGQFFASIAKTASALQFAIAGIRANGASSKIVYVRRMTVASSAAGLVTIFSCTGDPTLDPTGVASIGRNQNLSAAGSQCRGISGQALAAAPTAGELPGATSFATVVVPANTPIEFVLSRPIRMAPGLGVVAVPNIAAQTVFVSAAIEELDV